MNFAIVFNPFTENFLGSPVLLRVPSGKITADHLFSFILFENVINSDIACLESFLSINAAPPFLKLKEILGIPFPNSIFETNFGWCFLKNHMIYNLVLHDSFFCIILKDQDQQLNDHLYEKLELILMP